MFDEYFIYLFFFLINAIIFCRSLYIGSNSFMSHEIQINLKRDL